MKQFSGMIRRSQYGVLAVSILFSSMNVMAQGLGSVVAAKQNPLPVYATPNAPQAKATVKPENLPWPIKESKDDFFKVSVGGKDVWVDAMDVRAERQAVHHCSPTPGAKDAAGSPGAAGKNC